MTISLTYKKILVPGGASGAVSKKVTILQKLIFGQKFLGGQKSKIEEMGKSSISDVHQKLLIFHIIEAYILPTNSEAWLLSEISLTVA